jgi:hypothetical protein
MDKHIISLLDTRPDYQRTITRRRSDKQAGSFFERPALRNREEGILYSADLCRERALRCAEDARSNGELGLGGIGGRDDDGACEFGAGDPREG